MLVLPVMIIAMILFAIFAVVLLVISSLVLWNVMMKTERTAIMGVESTIIVVVRAPADSIRSVIVRTAAHSAPVATYPSKTQNYNTPQKLDRYIWCMLACHNQEGGMVWFRTCERSAGQPSRPESPWRR